MTNDVRDILIVKSEMLLTQSKMMEVYERILEQLDKGVIIIPEYFDSKIIQVPKDIQVRFECPKYAVGVQLGKE